MTRSVTPGSALTSITTSSGLSLSKASQASGLAQFSSTLAINANANLYEPIPDPKLSPMDSSPSNATIAMMQSFHLKGLEVASASYSIKGVSVGFPGMVGGIPGALAVKIIDSLPRAEDWL